ncbi:G-type lectin S-receptor-like serine/threonine-protein kinase CES101, partial [Fagus crenata]
MASKALKVLILHFLCLLLFLRPSSSSIQGDTLKQGQELKAWKELLSTENYFRLGFICSSECYLAIWYNDSRPEKSVWVGNRNNPIPFDFSAGLTIDDYGNLTISYDGGRSTFVLYSGQEARLNASAVLLDSGNFVLRELNSDGSVKRELWQSFDYPTNTLLPGMKLGVNRITGQTWSLRSWRGVDLPAEGSFTFGVDPNHTNQLVILWRQDIYWTSGSWYNGSFNSSSSLLTDSYCNFSYISNENETSFTCERKDSTPTYQRLAIDYLGILSDGSGTRVQCTPYDFFTTSDFYPSEGCVPQELPECRSRSHTFTPYPGLWDDIDGFRFDEGDNLTLMDCKSKCLKNCSCVAYASTNQDAQTGCQIWWRSHFLSDSNSPRTIYVLESE